MAKRLRYKKQSARQKPWNNSSRSGSASRVGMSVMTELEKGQLFAFVNGKNTYRVDYSGQYGCNYHEFGNKEKYYEVPYRKAFKTMVKTKF